MKKELITEITIRAPANKIWQVLCNFDNYPHWNPMIQSLRGELIEGKKVEVRLVFPSSRPITLKPQITKVVPNQQFRWEGHLLFNGLFDGEHIFEIQDNKDGTCTFRQKENFKGILIGLFSKMVDTSTKKGFELMNAALKARCEQSL